MTEEEWLTSEDPLTLLNFVPVSQRKGKLFVTGCCRCHAPVARSPANRKWVSAIEEYVDGIITSDQLIARRGRTKLGYRIASACSVTVPVPIFVGLATYMGDGKDVPHSIQVQIAREIFGNPFRRVGVTKVGGKCVHFGVV